MILERLTLADALAVATESQMEFEAVAFALSELAKREGKAVEWGPAIKALERAARASRRAADAVSQVCGAEG